ncbi:type IV pilin protein [Photobacterium damselae]|uniref:type IV pilin protein n=1 Tax=Photobacterium damselae TaxID=38293 RepID=UPI001EDEE631|nr:type IV pilin protein [Photobacterium damselae]MCG3845638.1 type IV pilin protein [Photobacterium damselae]
MSRQKGVTLIELLIAIVVIGVLAAIAYPSYQSHVIKAHRTQAMGDMIKIQLALEEQRTAGVSYANYTHTEIQNKLCAACVDKERYEYKVVSASTASYTIKAVPQEPLQNDPECNILYLHQTGKGQPSSCWH